jgi:hypothetical protein
MADDTVFQGITTSFIENRQESDNTNYFEKDKSQVMRNASSDNNRGEDHK